MNSMTSSSQISGYTKLNLDAFIRAVAVNRNAPHALLLGAGASITSGVPSANACIWDWKRRIFLTKNPGLESQFREFSLPSVQQKVQRWLDDQRIYPQAYSDMEYGFYVEQCYPLKDDRRQYFQNLAERAEPHVGYRILALLAEAGLISSTWTCNFDRLVAKAIDATLTKVTPIEVGLDSTDRADRITRKGELLCVAMHGDYRYDDLKNTPTELQSQDQALREALSKRLSNETLIVLGYSGRDNSIMQALEIAYSQPGKGRLYWCGHGDDDPPQSVSNLLELASKNGRTAVYVATPGFDDVILRLGLECTLGEMRDRVQKMYMGATPIPKSTPFEVTRGQIAGIIKSNAFQVECPTELLQFETDGFEGRNSWNQIEKQCGNRPIVAAPLRNKIMAIGLVDDVRDAFGKVLKGNIERIPLTEDELENPNSIITSLLVRALVRGLATARNLDTDGRSLVWKKNATGSLRIYATDIAYHDAALLGLKRYAGKHYLVINPSIKGLAKNGSTAPIEVEKELRRQILSGQHNKQFNEALNSWGKLLLPGQEDVKLEFPIRLWGQILTSPITS
jgi:hypothetical protein